MNDSVSDEPFNDALKKNKGCHYTNNLTKKIANPPNLKCNNFFCLWSDLLGFGNMWIDCGWEPNIFQRKKIYKRLQRAHSAAIGNSTPFEQNLILNDGIAKVLPVPDFWERNKLLYISLYLRGCIILHNQINAEEMIHKYPGTRSVLASGMGIEYLTEHITYDDFVLNYTKPKGSDTSSLVKDNGDRVVLYNPKELQMNTAFSKAYILDSLGKASELEGNHFFVDQSVLEMLGEIAKKEKITLFEQFDKDSITILYPYNKLDNNLVYLGFEFDRAIPVEYKGWITTVYRLKKFFPHDEKRDEFCFEL